MRRLRVEEIEKDKWFTENDERKETESVMV